MEIRIARAPVLETLILSWGERERGGSYYTMYPCEYGLRLPPCVSGWAGFLDLKLISSSQLDHYAHPEQQPCCGTRSRPSDVFPWLALLSASMLPCVWLTFCSLEVVLIAATSQS